MPPKGWKGKYGKRSKSPPSLSEAKEDQTSAMVGRQKLLDFEKWIRRSEQQRDYHKAYKLGPTSDLGIGVPSVEVIKELGPESWNYDQESLKVPYLSASDREELASRRKSSHYFGTRKQLEERENWLKGKERTFLSSLTQEERDYVDKGVPYKAVTPDFLSEAKRDQIRRMSRDPKSYLEEVRKSPSEELLDLGVSREESWSGGIGSAEEYHRRIRDVVRARDKEDLLTQMQTPSRDYDKDRRTRRQVEEEAYELYQFLKVPVLEAVEDCGQTHTDDEEKGLWCSGAEIYSSFINSYGPIRVPTLAGASTRLPDSRTFFWRAMGGMTGGKTPLLETQYMYPTHYAKKKIRMFKLSLRGEEALRSGLN